MIKGSPFRFSKTNPALPYLTISERIKQDLTVFSLGASTEISKESYPSKTLYICLSNEGVLAEENCEKRCSYGDAYISQEDALLGKKARKEGFLYLEWQLPKGNKMNPLLKKGEVFALKDLLPYQEGKIVNLTVVETPTAQMAIIAMAKGCELSPHKAPGEALLLILDGEGVIDYEGVSHPVKEGDSFSFAKGGLHGVKAKTNFKFALLLEKGN